MTNEKTNKDAIRNFDTIKLEKRIKVREIKSGSHLIIVEGYYDVIANDDKDFLLAPNTANGTRFAPHTHLLYAAEKELVYKNAVKTHTH